jgi:hypothetical protein
MSKWQPKGDVTTIARASMYESLDPLLKAMYQEFQELSRKKQEGVLNRNKIQMVNRLLKDVLTILEAEPSRGYLNLVDEDDVPQNSDIALLLSQYRAAMKQFHEKYFRYDPTTRDHRWWVG